MSALDEALKDLKTRGEAIDAKPNTGSTQNQNMKGRGDGYREAVSLIEAALAEDAKDSSGPRTTDTCSIDYDFNGNVTVKLIDFTDGEMVDLDRLKLSPEQALYFLSQVASRVTAATERTMRGMTLGDCPTCLNRRLVDVVLPGNRSSNKHCPDCSSQTFDGVKVPQVGGGLK